mgnify:FL=1
MCVYLRGSPVGDCVSGRRRLPGAAGAAERHRALPPGSPAELPAAVSRDQVEKRGRSFMRLILLKRDFIYQFLHLFNISIYYFVQI